MKQIEAVLVKEVTDSGDESDGYSYTGPTKESLCRLRYSEYCDWMDNKCYQKRSEIDRLYPGEDVFIIVVEYQKQLLIILVVSVVLIGVL